MPNEDQRSKPPLRFSQVPPESSPPVRFSDFWRPLAGTDGSWIIYLLRQSIAWCNRQFLIR